MSMTASLGVLNADHQEEVLGEQKPATRHVQLLPDGSQQEVEKSGFTKDVMVNSHRGLPLEVVI